MAVALNPYKYRGPCSGYRKKRGNPTWAVGELRRISGKICGQKFLCGIAFVTDGQTLRRHFLVLPYIISPRIYGYHLRGNNLPYMDTKGLDHEAQVIAAT